MHFRFIICGFFSPLCNFILLILSVITGLIKQPYIPASKHSTHCESKCKIKTRNIYQEGQSVIICESVNPCKAYKTFSARLECISPQSKQNDSSKIHQEKPHANELYMPSNQLLSYVHLMQHA